MNRSLAIRFQPGGSMALVTDAEVTGFAAVVQSALVNLLTEGGTDMLYPSKGTQLFRTALDGGIFNVRSAAHACNFAASDTLFFSREEETADTADKLEQVALAPTFLGFGRLDVEASFVSVDGRNMSFPLPSNIQ